MISIIIPTLNEEKYLPRLLNSIKRQDFKNYEIIVSDAHSKDKTLEIARSYGCKTVVGGLPSKGRNEGAKVSNGDILLFLDADVFLPRKDFLSKTLNEFKERNLDMATFTLVPIRRKRGPKLFFDFFYNYPILFMENFLPHAAMGILIKKSFFDKLKGFDEEIKVSEDNDLARRLAKIGKFGILRSVKLFISDRRFRTDGWIKTALKDLAAECHTIFIGPIKSDILNYRFGHYYANNKKLKKKNLFKERILTFKSKK